MKTGHKGQSFQAKANLLLTVVSPAVGAPQLDPKSPEYLVCSCDLETLKKKVGSKVRRRMDNVGREKVGRRRRMDKVGEDGNEEMNYRWDLD